MNFVRADNETAIGSAVANWSRSVTLNPGKNTICVTATDNSIFPQESNKSIVVFFNIRDQLAPRISIDSHSNNQVMTSPSILLSGTVSDSGFCGNGVSFVRVNGSPATGAVTTGSATAARSRTVALTPDMGPSGGWRFRGSGSQGGGGPGCKHLHHRFFHR